MTERVWRKSSRSSTAPNCVEFAPNENGGFDIRDSKNPSEGTLSLNPNAVAALLDGVKGGRLDRNS